MRELNKLINETLEIQDFIEIFKDHMTELGFKETFWSSEHPSENYIEMEYEGNYRHVVLLSKSTKRWYFYYNIYTRKKTTLNFTNTEIFTTDKEFKEILNNFDKEFDGRE